MSTIPMSVVSKGPTGAPVARKALPTPELPAAEAGTTEPDSWGEIMPWVPVVIPVFGGAFAAVIYVVAWAALRGM